jgi:hypothetical protein
VLNRERAQHFLTGSNYSIFLSFFQIEDSILFVVIPKGNVFHAQKISELEIKQNEEHDVTTDFEKLEDIFTRVKEHDISHFKTQALQIMKRNHSK